MKHQSLLPRRRFWLIPLLLLVAVAASAFAERRIVSNPYEAVDWDLHQQYSGTFHAHSRQSDGRMHPADVIDAYRAIGHRILALTDHDKYTWPWQRFGRDPEALGMIAVPGNELSRHPHILSLFNDLVATATDTEGRLREVQENGGLSVLAHPGRYHRFGNDGRIKPGVLRDHAALFRQFPTLIGMEVINKDNRFPRDRALWDALLTELMPERPVWGMANDDSHEAADIGINTTVLMLSTFDLAAVRAALATGRFYYTTVSTHPEETRDRAKTPVIRAVVYDRQAGTLSVRADPGTAQGVEPLGDDRFQWISAGGAVIHAGPTLHLNMERIARYVRLEIRGEGGTAYTQPFGIGEVEPRE